MARPGPVLIPREEIEARVSELGRALQAEYAPTVPLLVVVLKGAVFFAADLLRAMRLPLEVEFIGVSSYGASTRSSGAVRLTADLSVSIEGRDVVLVEDIVDTGRTLSYLRRNLATRHPRSLAACALLDKVPRREVDVPVEHVGFAIPDRFVVGYGFDVGGLYRTLPDIHVLDPAARDSRPEVRAGPPTPSRA